MKLVKKDKKFLRIGLRNNIIINNFITYDNFASFLIIYKYAFSDKNDLFYKIALELYIKQIIENAIYREKLYLKQKLENNLIIKNS